MNYWIWTWESFNWFELVDYTLNWIDGINTDMKNSFIWSPTSVLNWNPVNRKMDKAHLNRWQILSQLPVTKRWKEWEGGWRGRSGVESKETLDKDEGKEEEEEV